MDKPSGIHLTQKFETPTLYYNCFPFNLSNVRILLNFMVISIKTL